MLLKRRHGVEGAVAPWVGALGFGVPPCVRRLGSAEVVRGTSTSSSTQADQQARLTQAVVFFFLPKKINQLKKRKRNRREEARSPTSGSIYKGR